MSGLGEGSVPGFQTATCSPCAHMAFLQGMLSGGTGKESEGRENEREGREGGKRERTSKLWCLFLFF